MTGGYLAQVQKLIDEKFKDNPDGLKQKLKEIEKAKKKVKEAQKSPPKPIFDPQLTQELIEEMDKDCWSDMDIQKIKDLIKRGADIKAKTGYKFTVLHIASYFGDIELAKECLQAGIDIDSKDDDGRLPLHLAGSVTIAKLLISAGTDVNVKNKHGKSPLYYAVDRKNIALAEYLISEGANVNAKDIYGKSPLYYAYLHNNKEMQALLKRHGATY